MPCYDSGSSYTTDQRVGNLRDRVKELETILDCMNPERFKKTVTQIKDDFEIKKKEFRHNSDVAELLCSVLKLMKQDSLNELFKYVPGVGLWWEEHKKRDLEKDNK
jgi:hypothetical protein